MNYTTLTLCVLGIAGILVHILKSLDKINRSKKGVLRVKEYFRVEIFSILISLLVVVVSLIISQEIAQLEVSGKWLGFGFFAIGYMGQSVLVYVMGRANKILNPRR